jgi:hypothetical protein
MASFFRGINKNNSNNDENFVVGNKSRPAYFNLAYNTC